MCKIFCKPYGAINDTTDDDPPNINSRSKPPHQTLTNKVNIQINESRYDLYFALKLCVKYVNSGVLKEVLRVSYFPLRNLILSQSKSNWTQSLDVAIPSLNAE